MIIVGCRLTKVQDNETQSLLIARLVGQNSRNKSLQIDREMWQDANNTLHKTQLNKRNKTILKRMSFDFEHMHA